MTVGGTLLALASGVQDEPMERQLAADATPEPSTGSAEFTTDPQDRRRRRLVVNKAFGAIKAKHASERTWIQRAADALNNVASSTPFFAAHVIWFTVWILWNTGSMGLVPFDPFPFGLLTMVVSLEAIFLSIFVLMAQKRESAIAELREELTLQVNLRMEEEVTKTLQLVAGLYTRLGHQVAEDPELADMMQPLDVTGIEEDVAAQIAALTGGRRRRLRKGIAATSEQVR